MAAPLIRRVCTSCLLKTQSLCPSPLRGSVLKEVKAFSGLTRKTSDVLSGCVRSWSVTQSIIQRNVETGSGKNSNASLQVFADENSSDRDFTEIDEVSLMSPDTGVVSQVNSAIAGDDLGRLFAVVHLAGSQFKITTDDIVVVQGTFPPEVGDRIRLEKVLIAGSKDFTLVGRPMLDRDLVKIEATVIEKTLSVPKVKFNYIKRSRYRKFKLLQIAQTMLVINSIQVSTVGDNQSET